MKNISTKIAILVCACSLLTGMAVAATILATSNIIHITVTAPPPPTYTVALTVNGTSADPYVGEIHPGDKLILVATGNANTAGKTVTFFNNAAYPINSQTIPPNGVAEYDWIVPSLTSAPNNDVYALRAEIT